MRLVSRPPASLMLTRGAKNEYIVDQYRSASQRRAQRITDLISSIPPKITMVLLFIFVHPLKATARRRDLEDSNAQNRTPDHDHYQAALSTTVMTCMSIEQEQEQRHRCCQKQHIGVQIQQSNACEVPS